MRRSTSGPVGAAQAQTYTIKIAFLGSQADEDYDGSLVFKDFVEGRTNGDVAVEIYTGGQFCSKFMEWGFFPSGAGVLLAAGRALDPDQWLCAGGLPC